MHITASIGGRSYPNDTRSLAYFVGLLKLKASSDADPYFLAAIVNALHGSDPELYELIQKSAGKLVNKHAERAKQIGERLEASKNG